jgi:hypothetical protein
MELEDLKRYELVPGFEIQCAGVLPFDSWICFRAEGKIVLNVNDCIVDGEAKAETIKKSTGEVDILFTQFSYAAWKGNENDIKLREASAAGKLKVVQDQIHVFKPKYTIPFASFVYFSHEENKYMNQGINKPAKACEAILSAGSTPVLLYPGDVWNVDQTWDNTSSSERYEREYAMLPTREYHKSKKSFTEIELIQGCNEYLKRLKKKNNFFLIRLARYLPVLRVFRPFTLKVEDLNAVYSFDIFKGLERLPEGSPYDIKIHSECLDYVFRFEWGYDTLTVNGRFRADMNGFQKMTKNFAIGPLNNIGSNVSLKLLFDYRLIGSFLKMLSSFARRVKPNHTS